MKLYRKYRRTRRHLRWVLVAATLGAALLLGGCDLVDVDGDIVEIEDGRNGVKAEIKNGDDAYEVYLIPGTVCKQHQALDECADTDDFLVPAKGAIPGINGR